MLRTFVTMRTHGLVANMLLVAACSAPTPAQTAGSLSSTAAAGAAPHSIATPGVAPHSSVPVSELPLVRLVQEDDAERIKRLSGSEPVERVIIWPISDRTMQLLGKRTELRALSMSPVGIHPGEPNRDVQAGPLSDEAFALVAGLTELEVLDVSGVSGANMQHLVGLEKLKKLSVEVAPEFTVKGLEYLTKLPQLEELKLYGKSEHLDALAGLGPLATMTSFGSWCSTGRSTTRVLRR